MGLPSSTFDTVADWYDKFNMIQDMHMLGNAKALSTVDSEGFRILFIQK